MIVHLGGFENLAAEGTPRVYFIQNTAGLIIVQAYAPYDPKVNATTRKFIDNVLLAIGVSTKG